MSREPTPIGTSSMPGLLAEIDSAWLGLSALLSVAASNCSDYPGARRMLSDHAELIARAERSYRARLATELPKQLRHSTEAA